MKSILIPQNKKILNGLFDTINFQLEFNTILSFVSELCEVPYVFITLIDSDNHIIKAKLGFDFLIMPKNILLLSENVIQQDKIYIVSDLNKESKHQSSNSSSHFSITFFAGIPLSIGGNLSTGTLCIMDSKLKVLSPIQLKTLEHSALQIQTMLELWQRNQELEKIAEAKQTQFELFVDNSKEIVYEVNMKGKIIYASKNWTKYLGHEIEEVTGNYQSNFIHPEDVENCRSILSGITLKEKRETEIKYRILHKNGHYLWRTSTIKLMTKNGEQYYVGNCRDITEYMETQQKILKQKEFYESILDKLPTDVAVFDKNHKYIYLNQYAIKNKELRKFIIGKDDFEYAHYTGKDNAFAKNRREKFLQVLSLKEPVEWEEEFKGNQGKSTYHTRKLTPVFRKNGSFEMVIGFGFDITERKKAEDALKISHERFTFSSKATSDAIWDWDLITDIIITGESFESLFGHKFHNNTMTAKDCENFVHPEDREAVSESMDKVINSKIDKWSYEYRYLKSDGTYADVCDKAIIIRNDEGVAIRMIGAMQDITIEKKLEAELRQSEKQFKGAFEFSTIGMAIVNPDGYFTEVNDVLCKMLGYSKEEFKTLTFIDVTHPEDIEEDLAYKNKLDSGEISSFTIEKRYLHKNKSIVWVRLSISLVRKRNGEIMHYIPQIIDTTVRKRIEEENRLLLEENNRNRAIQLNEAKNLYRLLADNTADLVCLHNLDASFQYVSPSIKTLLGYTPEEMIGKSPMNYAHPDDLDKLHGHLIDFITEKLDSAIEARYINAQGDYIWFETKANIVKENGIAVSFYSATRDITQRKEVEAVIEKTLLQERKLNELRTNLVSTISHEFRTPMTTIRTSAELIGLYLEGQDLKNAQNLEKRVHSITREIDRIVELMDSILTISKEDAGKTNFNPIVFDLKQVCLDVIEASYSNQPDGRKVQVSTQGNKFKVFADRNLMEYTLFNLLSNAFKYSEGFGDVFLDLFVDSSEIVIQIRDLGIGIPDEDQSKLFNTFYRASNTNGIQGTGLGLYIVKTFTEKNSGKIKLESQLRKGTRVTLEFPIQKS